MDDEPEKSLFIRIKDCGKYTRYTACTNSKFHIKNLFFVKFSEIFYSWTGSDLGIFKNQLTYFVHLWKLKISNFCKLKKNTISHIPQTLYKQKLYEI